ncbi:hypothetical protein O181_021520 [Austropuccinia psidii MF-1]|uniref:Uncharacterized protein n=1 Tax=Austropuccinia psidii MF-1 TaxID=1389203 RepID=A0A9Q3CES6_9BASI|nr:hypothetical protein [Austropuccinia psidii MF-1]
MVGSIGNIEESKYSCLPPQASIHPFFHISLLEPVKTSTIPNWHQEPHSLISIEEEEEWEVSQIMESKIKRKIMVLCGMDRFQSRPRKIHLGTNQKPQELPLTYQRCSFFIS